MKHAFYGAVTITVIMVGLPSLAWSCSRLAQPSHNLDAEEIEADTEPPEALRGIATSLQRAQGEQREGCSGFSYTARREGARRKLSFSAIDVCRRKTLGFHHGTSTQST